MAFGEAFDGPVPPVYGVVAGGGIYWCFRIDGGFRIDGFDGVGQAEWEVEGKIVTVRLPNGFKCFWCTPAIPSAEVFVADALAVVGTSRGTFVIDEAVAKSRGTAGMMRRCAVRALVGGRLVDVEHVVAVSVVGCCVARCGIGSFVAEVAFARGFAVRIDVARAVAGTCDAVARVFGYDTEKGCVRYSFIALLTKADGHVVSCHDAYSVASAVYICARTFGILDTDGRRFCRRLVALVTETGGRVVGRNDADAIFGTVDAVAGIRNDVWFTDPCVGGAVDVAFVTHADCLPIGGEQTRAMAATCDRVTCGGLRYAVQDIVLGMLIAFLAETGGTDRGGRKTLAVATTCDAFAHFINIMDSKIFLA